ncbi:putative monocarboxylate transporter mch1 [Globomyces sp. JEL0801]|nr:putative monocarboxylate transporter mch1 [Globomyces sp. JEL0801]
MMGKERSSNVIDLDKEFTLTSNSTAFCNQIITIDSDDDDDIPTTKKSVYPKNRTNFDLSASDDLDFLVDYKASSEIIRKQSSHLSNDFVFSDELDCFSINNTDELKKFSSINHSVKYHPKMDCFSEEVDLTVHQNNQSQSISISNSHHLRQDVAYQSNSFCTISTKLNKVVDTSKSKPKNSTVDDPISSFGDYDYHSKLLKDNSTVSKKLSLAEKNQKEIINIDTDNEDTENVKVSYVEPKIINDFNFSPPSDLNVEQSQKRKRKRDRNAARSLVQLIDFSSESDRLISNYDSTNSNTMKESITHKKDINKPHSKQSDINKILEQNEKKKEKEQERIRKKQEKEVQNQQKQALKEAQKLQKLLQKQSQEQQKLQESSIKSANTLRQKLDCTKDMILNFCNEWKKNPLIESIQTSLNSSGCQIEFKPQKLKYSVTFNRKNNRIFDFQTRYWKPCEVAIEIEPYLMVYLNTERFVELMKSNSGLIGFYKNCLSLYPNFTIILLIQGLEDYHKKSYSHQRKIDTQKLKANYFHDQVTQTSRNKASEIEYMKLQLYSKGRCKIHHCNETEVAMWMVSFTQQIALVPESFSRSAEQMGLKFADNIKSGATAIDTWEKMLTQISRISPSYANAIVNSYPNVQSLMTAIKAVGIANAYKLLVGLSVHVEKERCIGEITAKRIVQILTASDPDAMVID